MICYTSVTRKAFTVFSFNLWFQVLDFSHNNISYVEEQYFSPIRDSLTQLILSHNSIRNISRDVLPEMPQLQYLDISHNNKNFDIEFDALRNLPLLQVFEK